MKNNSIKPNYADMFNGIAECYNIFPSISCQDIENLLNKLGYPSTKRNRAVAVYNLINPKLKPIPYKRVGED